MARVEALTPILHDGVLYKIGEQIDMTDVQEQRLVDAAAAVIIPEEEVTVEAVVIPVEEVVVEAVVIPVEELAAASKANAPTK